MAKSNVFKIKYIENTFVMQMAKERFKQVFKNANHKKVKL